MWPVIRELMDQFPEPVIVLGANDEILLSNRQSGDALACVDSAVRMLRAPNGMTSLGSQSAIPGYRQLSQELSGNFPSILTLRSQEKFIFISPSFVKVFGCDPENLYKNSANILSFVHPRDRDFVRTKMEGATSGEALDFSFRLYQPAGELRRLQVTEYPFLDEKTGEVLVAAVYRNLAGEGSTKVRPFPRPSRTATGVIHPKMLRQKLEERLVSWKQDPGSGFFAVAFLDLTRFRAINDSIGYEAGDRLLREFGSRILKLQSNGDLLVQFGGDNFGLLMGSVTSQHEAEDRLRHILRELDTPYAAGPLQVSIPCRAGLAFPQNLETSVDSVLRDADSAHQQARIRREALVVAVESAVPKSLTQIALEADLSQALERNEFYFDFQPVFDPKTGRLRLLEALMRWRHPRLGVISPTSFIKLAEDSGLVLNLDMKGLAMLERQSEAWRAIDPQLAEVPLSLNISGRHFPHFVMEKQFHQMLKLPSLSKSRIIFELTESVFVETTGQTIAALQGLRDAGVQIWLDDFGEGYSSFRYLNQFRVDGIKISECFVRHCAQEARSRLILSSLYNLGRGMGVQVVAEGVETREQFETLRGMGFDALQGFYLARPMAASEIPLLLESSKYRPMQLPRIA